MIQLEFELECGTLMCNQLVPMLVIKALGILELCEKGDSCLEDIEKVVKNVISKCEYIMC